MIRLSSGPLRLAAMAVAVAALLLVGCARSPEPSGSPSPTTALRPGVQYALVDDLCAHVNLGAITKVLPHVAEQMHELDNPVPNARNCYGTLGLSGNPDEQGGLNVLLEVFDTDTEAEAHYDQFYQVNIGLSSATNVDGIGEKAYQFTVPVAGSQPSVRVLDGNAVFTCEWLPLDKLATPGGLVEALTETIRGTAASLQNSQ